ncbi:MAG: glucosyltransferase [Thelocarpon superellum]|nr:MAG: glucosyltransferase [Thelocarpon superellum]
MSTNIFWVAAFLGGLEMVRTLQSEAPPEDVHDSTFSDVVARSWSLGQTYDPPAGDAHLEDYLKTGLSLAVATCASIGKAIRALLPYLTVLASFAGFVAWNGGVVLGDKSNHIMTLHLPQMLYIWAFFMFFSFPILSSSLVDALIPANALPKLFRSSSRPSAAITLRQASIIVTAISLMLMIVHFNTFAHPFTLSDNRHYVFYIFRWFLLRHAVFKYLATPVYLLCGWSVIGALGERRAPSTPGKIPKKPAKSGIRQREHSLPVQGNRVSFVIIWLLSTSLALVTVPLVEPRYFIVPWVIWRLHVPSTITPVGEWVNERLQGWWPTIPRVDIPRLALETLWFMLLNFITGYVFLYRGFEWPQEPGLVQRFMW